MKTRPTLTTAPRKFLLAAIALLAVEFADAQAARAGTFSYFVTRFPYPVHSQGSSFLSGLPFLFATALSHRYEGFLLVVIAILIALQTSISSLWVIEKTRRKRTRHENRILSARIINAAEEERKNIARELHDDFAQRLSLLMLNIDQLRADVGPQGAARIQDIWDALDKLTTDIHEMSHRLHSSRLRHLGLSAALRDVCQSVSARHHIPVEFYADQDYGNLPEHIALCFYRVAQEALSNAAKYSESPSVEVKLTENPGRLAMSVTDFGVGFDPDSPTEGMGLSSMRERLRMIGGSLHIQTHPGKGTKLVAEAPTGIRTAPQGHEEFSAVQARKHERMHC